MNYNKIIIAFACVLMLVVAVLIINNSKNQTTMINARCNDYKTTRLFSHELKIKEFEDGSYHYIGNKVTYKSDNKLPTSEPRLPMQRETY